MIHTGLTVSAELRFRQILEDFFISVYDEKSLPSHGITHHRRVWSFARELLNLPCYSTSASGNLAVKLIIASYLHDIGMSVEKGLRHGKHSRDFSIEFLTSNNLNPEDFTDLLDAIENHDRKNYLIQSPDNVLLTLLSLADDLDAFGFIGIYRYTEIYHLREIKPEFLGYRIQENAKVRFDNLEKTLATCSEFVQKNKIRYKILDNFFTEYNRQAETYSFGGSNPNGFCGAIELLIQYINNQENIMEYSRLPEKCLNDHIISFFFKELISEISGLA